MKKTITMCTIAAAIILSVVGPRATQSVTYSLDQTSYRAGDLATATVTGGEPYGWFEWVNAYWNGSSYVVYWSGWYQFDENGNFTYTWNLGGAGNYQDWVVFDGIPSNTFEYEILPSVFEVAAHWSPVFFQATTSHISFDEFWMLDIPVQVDFDGDWVGDNNWASAINYMFSVGPSAFPVRVYYSFVETDTNIFLNYVVFHPVDWKAAFGHENDLEGAMVVLNKVAGYPYGQFAYFGAFGHGSWEFTYFPEWPDGGTHPAAYIETKGHGIHVGNDDYFPGACGGLGISYQQGGSAEAPEHCDDRGVGMELIPFETTLWPRRLDYPYGLYVNGALWVTGAWFGGAIAGHDGCKAHFPWNWTGDDGASFLTPDINPPIVYVVNPYLSSQSTGVSDCPY